MGELVLEPDGMSRRSFLKTGAVGAAVVAAGLTSPALTGTAKADGGRRRFTLDVLADVGALDMVAGAFAGQGPFYIPGEIFAHGTNDSIGVFHCWGYFFDGGALGVVSQEYDLAGHGKIQVQGVEDEGPRAVTGGTGRFRKVRGEMTGADLSAFPFFTATFRLNGASFGNDDDDDD